MREAKSELQRDRKRAVSNIRNAYERKSKRARERRKNGKKIVKNEYFLVEKARFVKISTSNGKTAL